MTAEASGADLARLAFQAARAAAKTRPTTQPKLRTAKPIRGERREPAGLGNVLGNLTAELGWQTGVQGGDLLTQWPDLCPQYVGHVEPVHYDPQTRRLDLRPSSHAYAANLRLLGGQLCKTINDKVGQEVVRSLRVLPVGPVSSEPLPQHAPPPAAAVDLGPVKTRETACAGYKATLAAVRKPEARTVDPKVLEAIARQNKAIRGPEEAFADTAAAMEQLASKPVRESERARLAALAFKSSASPGLRNAFGAA